MIIEKNRHMNELMKLFRSSEAVTAEELASFTDSSVRTVKDGDFVVIDDDFNVVHTYSRGVSVYDQSKDGKIFNEAYIDSIRK